MNIQIKEVISFFIYDSIKIGILLFLMVAIVSFIRTYINRKRISNFLSNKFSIIGNLIVSIIGIVTPFCSCSAIPFFLGLIESGVPLGISFSYIVSAPMINETAVVLLLVFFGYKIATLYILSGIMISVFTGYVIGKLNVKRLLILEDHNGNSNSDNEQNVSCIKDRICYAIGYSMRTFKNIYIYILIGIAIGSIIHGYVPSDYIQNIAKHNQYISIPIVVLIGIPLYCNVAGTVPIILSLMQKGLPIGTALAFMMSITALSLPELLILRKVMKTRLLIIYVSIMFFGIVTIGYLFNWII